jgi:lipopolysaccharide biosynthesis glycosyltransferase
LALPKSSYYFNAGVLLIDLNAWRQQDVLSRGIRFAQSHADRLEFWDQDVLNHLFEATWLPFHARWNALPHLWSLNKALRGRDAILSPQDIAARDHPAIIHFAGPGVTKPWNYHCEHPWKQRYLDSSERRPLGRRQVLMISHHPLPHPNHASDCV